MTPPHIVCLPGTETFAKLLGFPIVDVTFDTFPDGESYVRCCSDVSGKSVAILAELANPDPQLMRLFLTAKMIKDQGADHVGLIAPYLPYLRQDTEFKTGEAVSALHFGKFLSGLFDWVVTVDPHLHRLKSLSEIFSIPACAVSSSKPISDWISRHIDSPILIGPDSESHQWVEILAKELGGVPYHTFEKTRLDSWSVEVSANGSLNLEGRTPVIVDDIASTGRTLLRLEEYLAPLTPSPIFCCVTHGLFSDPIRIELYEVFNGRLVTTNTITGPEAKIDISKQVHHAILKIVS